MFMFMSSTRSFVCLVSGGLFHGMQLWVNLPARRSGRRPGTRTSARPRSGWWPPTTAARCCGSSPASWRATGPGDTYSPMTMVHATLAPGARLEVPWRGDYNALAYVLAGAARSAPTASRSGPASSRCSPRATRSWRGRAGPGTATRPSSRCCCSAAARSASRWPGWAVRDEHPRRGHPGADRLSGRATGSGSGGSTYAPSPRGQRRHRPGLVGQLLDRRGAELPGAGLEAEAEHRRGPGQPTSPRSTSTSGPVSMVSAIRENGPLVSPITKAHMTSLPLREPSPRPKG